jgi:hypothetical protein
MNGMTVKMIYVWVQAPQNKRRRLSPAPYLVPADGLVV